MFFQIVLLLCTVTSRISETHNSVNSLVSAIKGCHQSLLFTDRKFSGQISPWLVHFELLQQHKTPQQRRKRDATDFYANAGVHCMYISRNKALSIKVNNRSSFYLANFKNYLLSKLCRSCKYRKCSKGLFKIFRPQVSKLAVNY